MLKNTARLSILFVILISIILGYFIKDLRLNYVFESFFPTDDPELEYYREFEKLFDNDNDYLLVGLEHGSSIFDSTFLSKVSSLTRSLKNIDHVEEVVSLTTIVKPIISPAGYFEIPVLHPLSPERYHSDSVRLFKDEWLVESFISSDGTATAIVLKHEALSGKGEADKLVADIKSAIDQSALVNVHLAGKAYAQGVFIKKMQQELIMFLSASILLVIIFLTIVFRSWWAVLIPLIIVLLATVWILGIMALTGKTLDILMVLLPTIMFVVGMSDVVHIMTKYIEQLRTGDGKKDAILTTVKEVGMATFLTSLTTAVGFATLLTASIQPIKEFGVYTAIGVFIAFIVSFAILPAAFFLLPVPKLARKITHHAAWFGFLSRSFLLVSRNSKLVIAINLLFIAFSLYGMSQIAINTYLIEDLPQDDPLKQDFMFFDEKFGGSRPFEITATVQQDTLTIFNQDVLYELEKVQQYLKSTFGAGNILSPTTIVKGLNQAVSGGGAETYRLPASDREWKAVNKYLPRILKRDQAQNFTANNQEVGRISSRVGDIGSAISLSKTRDLQAFFKTQTNASLVQFKVTGTSNLIDKNNEYLAKNMFQGLGIAFLVIALIAGLLFKSLRMVIITLIPNIIPLLLLAGVMGMFGIALKLSTSIVFTIAFGIAVDDTIHFTSKLKIELNKGKSLLYALKRTYLSTGKAIIVTSLILSGGFLILILSSFGGTFYTGLLVSLTLIFALIIDLTLLPVLILLFYKRKPESTVV